jgi:Cu+-exporting ATPase
MNEEGIASSCCEPNTTREDHLKACFANKISRINNFEIYFIVKEQVDIEIVKKQMLAVIQKDNIIVFESRSEKTQFSLIVSGKNAMKQVLQDIIASKASGGKHQSCTVLGVKELHMVQYKMLEGLKCSGCVNAITSSVSEIPYVKAVHVDTFTKIVSIFGDEPFLSTNCEELLTKINSMKGKKAELIEEKWNVEKIIEIRVDGMRCQGCVGKIREALQKLENVHDVQVDLSAKKALVHTISLSNTEEFCQIIRKLGFEANLLSHQIQEQPVPELTPVVISEVEEEQLMSTDVHNQALLPERDDSGDLSMNIRPQLRKAIINIKKMSCASCVRKIEQNMKAAHGVQQCVVNLIMERGEVKYDSSLIDETALVKRIESLGFEVCDVTSKSLDQQDNQKENECIFKIRLEDYNEGDTSRLQDIFSIRDDIKSFDIEANEITIEYDDSMTNPRQLIRAIRSITPNVSMITNSDALLEITKQQQTMRETILRTEEIMYWRKLFIVSLVFTVPLMVISMIFGHIPYTQKYLMHEFGMGLSIGPTLYWILATPVQFYCGLPFYKLAFQALRHFSADMNVLIAIATTEAYLYSVFTILYNVFMTISMGPSEKHGGYGGDNYFETSAALIMFLLLGRWLENIAKGKTSSALVKLMDLQPHTATVIEFEQEGETKWENELHEYDIDISQVHLGDVLKVLPGGRIPVDGLVVKGSTTVDESMITGESLPVTKSENDTIIGGTVNIDGLLYMRATRTSNHSVLASIAKLVEDAQSQKPKLQAVADRISAYFVPFVISLSIITLVVWLILGYTHMYPDEWRPQGMNVFIFALLFSASTVIIACPCSLGLATPTAVMVGTGIGAMHGVLLKGGRALESVSKATVILFDKTGTLTKGELNVNGELYVGSIDGYDSLLQKVASVESSSDHPIAKALVRYIQQKLVSLQSSSISDFTNVSGRGVQCVIDNEIMHIGNEAFLREKGIAGIEEIVRDVEQNDMFSHSTLVYVARNQVIELVLGLTDTIKDESPAVIEKLSHFYPRGRKHGPIRAYMLTGDNERAARHIALQVGIAQNRVFASLTPSGKSDIVRQLQEQGEIVMMIGDGINDSPSLTQADVGVSVATGTDVAIECADVVLMTNNLQAMITAIDLSRVIYRRIIFNFVWAFIYNVAAIPIAAGVFFPIVQVMIPPWVAGLAMALSSVSVVFSSLALRLYKKP